MMSKIEVHKEYYRIINQTRHRVLRIREYKAGLKPMLSIQDLEFMREFEKKLNRKYKWTNYSTEWTIYQPNLKAKIIAGLTREEMLKAENFIVRTKATNIMNN